MWVKKQQLEPDLEKLVQKWERSMSRLYIVTLLIQLIYRIHHKMLGWMNDNLESRLLEEISTASDIQMILL